MYGDGLVRALTGRPGLSLVGMAANGQTAMTGIRQVRPDMAIIDVAMPKLTGIEVVAGILREGLDTRVLLLLPVDATDALIYAAFASGAAGCLGRGVDRDTICAAVGSIFRRELHSVGLHDEARVVVAAEAFGPIRPRQGKLASGTRGGALHSPVG